MNSYDSGDVVRVTAAFTNTSGTAYDPSTVSCKIKQPDGTVTTYIYGTDAELVKASTGNYYIDVDGDTPGKWHYRFYSTGSGKAAAEGTFKINNSEFS